MPRYLLLAMLVASCVPGAALRSHALWGGGARLSISISAAEPPPESLLILLDGLPIEPGPDERLLMVEANAGHHSIEVSAQEPWIAEPAQLQFQLSRQGETRYTIEAQTLPLSGAKIYRLQIRRVD